MSELETKVAVLERDVLQMSGYYDKIDATMEKLTDISISLKEMLAVHDHKLSQHALADEDLYGLHQESSKRFDELHSDFITMKNKMDLHKWYFTAIAVVDCFIMFKMGLIPFMPPFIW